MNNLKKLDQHLNRLEAGLLIGLLTVMMVLAFAQVVLRNLFATGIIWADVLLRHLLLWVGFLGAAIATSEGRHINIGALRKFLPAGLRMVIEVLTDLFAAGICLLLLKAAWVFVQSEIADQRIVFAQVPAWYLQIIIPAGFGLLAVHFAVRAILRVRTIKAQGDPT